MAYDFRDPRTIFNLQRGYSVVLILNSKECLVVSAESFHLLKDVLKGEAHAAVSTLVQGRMIPNAEKKRMVEKLGGEVQFDSAHNKGSEFFIRLPLRQQHS